MTKLQIEAVPLLSDNYAWLLHEPLADVTAVVDPGEADPVSEALARAGRRLDWILITHRHGDHVGGVEALRQATGAKVAGPRKEVDAIPGGVDRQLGEGDHVSVGGAEGRLFDTPGHTRGHVSIWFETSEALFSGDTLFSLGCGRLSEGTPEDMLGSLRKLAALPDDTLVYCGHEYTASNARFALSIDPDNAALQRRAADVERLRNEGRPTVPSRLGDEKAANPFLRAHDPAIRRHLGLETADEVEVFAEIRRRKDRA